LQKLNIRVIISVRDISGYPTA